jgi:putative transposase
MSLGRRYVQYINHTYRRTGTLWDSRYKSSLVHADTYLLACQRYIELNPVRAGMVDDPVHYRWSSYRVHALGQANDWLAPHELYLALGKEPKPRQAAYRTLFRSELDQEALAGIRLALNQNQPLGNARFMARIAKLMGERREARPRGRPRVRAEEGSGTPLGQGELGL